MNEIFIKQVITKEDTQILTRGRGFDKEEKQSTRTLKQESGFGRVVIPEETRERQRTRDSDAKRGFGTKKLFRKRKR